MDHSYTWSTGTECNLPVTAPYHINQAQKGDKVTLLEPTAASFYVNSELTHPKNAIDGSNDSHFAI